MPVKIPSPPVIELGFSRIKTNAWRDDLQQFLWKLDALVQDE